MKISGDTALRSWSLAGVLLVLAATPLAAQLRGQVAFEERLFLGGLPTPNESRHEASVILNAEYYRVWDKGSQSLAVEPFVRLGLNTGERTRVDFTELSWQYVWTGWELRVGLREVFWGVTESQHLVDVINQRDLVEAGQGYVKMGQSMVSLAAIRSWGTIDFLLLPWFRERTFDGRAGVLWSPLPVDADHAAFESASENWHLDWAVRWAQSVGDFDLGVAHFAGTNREPRFEPGQDESSCCVLVPQYDVVDQTSLDVQWTTGGWLWKLEATTLNPQSGRYAAVTGGFEYAFADYFSVFAEYVFDSRGDEATTSFEDDFFAGARLLLNDGQVLAWAFVDRDTGNRVLSLEVSQRLSDMVTLALEGRAFAGTGSSEPPHARRQDNYVALRASHYF